MTGDDQSRFCGQCQKNVYNLSNMTRVEAEELIRSKEGHLCVRYYMRPDGKVMTADCPKSVKRKVAVRVALTSLLALFGVGGCVPIMGSTCPTPQQELEMEVNSYPILKDEAKMAPTGPKGHSARQAFADCVKQIKELRAEIRSGK